MGNEFRSNCKNGTILRLCGVFVDEVSLWVPLHVATFSIRRVWCRLHDRDWLIVFKVDLPGSTGKVNAHALAHAPQSPIDES